MDYFINEKPYIQDLFQSGTKNFLIKKRLLISALVKPNEIPTALEASTSAKYC